MITETQYLEAKKILDKYEAQQKVKLERHGSGDIDLLAVLSKRPKNVLITHNESKWTKEGEEIIYVSDVIKAIRKDGRFWKGNGKNKGKIYYAPIIMMRGMGYKSYDEIMKYVTPHL